MGQLIPYCPTLWQAHASRDLQTPEVEAVTRTVSYSVLLPESAPGFGGGSDASGPNARLQAVFRDRLASAGACEHAPLGLPREIEV